jgi:predicted DNA-binding protein (MmcQ/YjbR family)
LYSQSDFKLNLPAIKKFCASMPHATADVKWGIDHVYSIGGKMFAVACKTEKGETHVSFKVDDDRFLEYTDRPGFIPAPYLARAKWVQLKELSAVSDAELKALIKRAYQLVAAKLTKKQQREFGLID